VLKVSRFRRGVATVLAAITLAIIPGGTALAQSGAQDCDDNAAIRCGAQTIHELKKKYDANQGGNLQALYRYFGINNASDLNGRVPGHVDANNDVYTDDGNNSYTKVAQNAFTAGRQDISNKFGSSTPILNGQFYRRTIQVAIGSKNGTLDALIKLDTDGKFLFGVITSCGNPVSATNVVKPKPQPQPTNTTKTTNKVTVVNNTTVNNTQQAPAKLADTGAGSMFGVFTAVSAAGTLAHRLYLKRRLSV